MTLNEIQGLNTYCGPAVLSALTGLSTDICADAISKITNERVIKGVTFNNLNKAAEKLGFKIEPVSLSTRTLYSFIALNVSRNPGSYIVMVPGHFVAIEITPDRRVYFIDNNTKHPINAVASARLTQQVKEVYKFTALTVEEKRELYKKSRIAHLESEIASLKYRIGALLSSLEKADTELQTLKLEDEDIRDEN